MLFFTQSHEKTRIAILIVGSIITTIIGLFFLNNPITNKNTETFTKQYEITFLQLQKYEQALFLPGSGSNIDRQNLNQTLEKILTNEMENKDRIKLSESGIRNLSTLKRQVAEIQKKKKLFELSLIELDKTIPSLPKKSKASAKTIVSLFSDYNSKAYNIPIFLEEMNDNIELIFFRIIEDNGELTDVFITELNDQIPKSEKTFDSLSFTYKDIIKIKKKLVSLKDLFFE